SGSVEVQTSEDLTFGPKSEVLGKITYKGPRAAVVQEGAKVGVIDFTVFTHKRLGHKFAALATLATIIKLLGLFLAAWVINRLFPGKFQTLANSANSKPWHNL